MNDLLRFLTLTSLFWILLPVGLAYFRVKRTKGHPFSSSLVYPGFLGGLYFATNYVLNLKTAERISGEPGFHSIVGYTDPFDPWPNLVAAFCITAWVFFTGTIGFGFYRFTKKNPTMPSNESR